MKCGIDVKAFDFELEKIPEDFADPRSDKRNLPEMAFGHFLADYVPDLELLGLKKSPEKTAESKAKEEDGFEILENIELAPNFHSLKIKAPDMAKYARAGHFAILMANADSERSPFTIADWNAEEGWVKFIIEEVGRSSAEIGALSAGDKLSVASGPLGTPRRPRQIRKRLESPAFGRRYGIGAIYPIAPRTYRAGRESRMRNRGFVVVHAFLQGRAFESLRKALCRHARRQRGNEGRLPRRFEKLRSGL